MAVNHAATDFMSRAAIAHFQKQGGGRIVNMAPQATAFPR